MKKIRRFIHLSARRKLLFFASAALSFYAWVLMRYFREKARFDGRKTQPVREADAELISDIRWAIFTAGRYIPWENVCRHQAYQAMCLCRYYKIPCQVFVGFKKNRDTGQIEGHAWTRVNGEFVTGFCEPEEYTVQAVYS